MSKHDRAALRSICIRSLIGCSLLLSSVGYCAPKQLNAGASPGLIAPLCITDAHFRSIVTVTNHGGVLARIVIVFESLIAEEVGRKEISIGPRASASIDLGTLYSTGHHFGTTGSITVSRLDRHNSTIDGYVTVLSRNDENTRLRENFVSLPLRPAAAVLTAKISSLFSVPVLAVHSLDGMAQHVAVSCGRSEGETLESEFDLPGHMTFLVNACIVGRSESRKYDQVLNGDSGPAARASVVRVSSDIPGGIAVWGFARTIQSSADSALKSINFVEDSIK